MKNNNLAVNEFQHGRPPRTPASQRDYAVAEEQEHHKALIATDRVNLFRSKTCEGCGTSIPNIFKYCSFKCKQAKTEPAPAPVEDDDDL